MTEQKEVYIILFEHRGSDCCLPHAFIYTTKEQAERELPNFGSNEGSTKYCRAIILAEYEAQLCEPDAQPT
ncbi:MAG: hypothetical protein HY535_06420 [Chloroflexi bacterium]|nr:hypothetical protein [Chloroflexota bacterium]